MSLSNDKIKDLLIKAFEENNYKKFSNSESKSAIVSKFDLIRNNISNYFSEKAKRNSEILKKEEQDIEFMQRDELSILHLMEQYIEKFSKNYEIEYIGIAAPGNPNQEELLIENLVNLGIEKLHLKPLEKRFNLPIRIKNDSKAAGVAEFKFGSLSK